MTIPEFIEHVKKVPDTHFMVRSWGIQEDTRLVYCCLMAVARDRHIGDYLKHIGSGARFASLLGLDTDTITRAVDTDYEEPSVVTKEEILKRLETINIDD